MFILIECSSEDMITPRSLLAGHLLGVLMHFCISTSLLLLNSFL